MAGNHTYTPHVTCWPLSRSSSMQEGLGLLEPNLDHSPQGTAEENPQPKPEVAWEISPLLCLAALFSVAMIAAL